MYAGFPRKLFLQQRWNWNLFGDIDIADVSDNVIVDVEQYADEDREFDVTIELDDFAMNVSAISMNDGVDYDIPENRMYELE